MIYWLMFVALVFAQDLYCKVIRKNASAGATIFVFVMTFGLYIPPMIWAIVKLWNV